MDFKRAILAMASARPDAPVDLMVDLALAVENALPTNLNDAKALGQWASRQPTVMAEVEAGRKIHAIKELRTLTTASLLQAKEAVEAIWP